MEPRINRSVRGARHVVRRWLITLSAISLLAAGQLVAGVPQTVAAASKPSAASAASAALARRSQCPAFPKHDRNSQQAYAFMLRHYGCSVPSLDALIQARRQAQVLAAVSTTGASWTALGPQPIQSIQNSYGSDGPVTGRVTALAVNPNNSAQVWLGGADGGVWYSNNSGGQWQPKTDTQPALPDLSIGSIAIDPRNTQTVYVGTGEPNGSDSYWGQGILRTTDGGTNWDTDTKNNELPFGFNYFAGLSVDKIIVDYDQNNNPIILAAVCCHQNDVTLPSSTGNNGGVWRSTDGGQTWCPALTYVTTSPQGCSSAPAPTPTTNPGDGGATDLVMDPDPTHPNILFAGLAQDGVSGASNSSIFESADYGATWQPVTGTGTGSVPVPASSDVLRVSLGVGISQDGTHLYLYALMADTLEGQLHNNCIYTSQDGGTTWSCTAQSWDSGESFWNYDSVIAVDPISATTAYAGGVDLWKTIDGGTSWTNVTNGYNLAGQGAFAGVHVDQHAIAFIPSTPGSNATPLYLGNDGGVWSATTAGQTTMAFTDLNDNGSGLDLTQFYAGSVGTTGTSSQLYGASQDNGVEQYPAGSISGAKTWNEVQGGDGWNVVVDPTNNANVYAENNGYINGEETAQVLRSTDGGSTWSTGFQVPLSEFAGLYPPLALSPNNASEVLLATDRLHKSTDGGTSWSSSGASQFQSPQGVEHATSLAVAPGDDNRTYVGTDTSHVWVSTDGGSTWNETQSQPVPPNSNALVTGLAVDPSNENTVYVTYSTYAKCQSSTDPCGQHVYRTTNGGSTWTDISWDGSSCTSLDAACLPNAPFEGVVLVSTPCGSSCQPTTDIIVASDVGVFESTDSGASWAQLGYGLPTTQIDQVFADASGTNIYVATHGRGMWRISTPFRVYSVTCNTGTGATNEVYALDASTTGTLDWVHSTTACTNKPAVLNSTVYVTVQNGGGVLALDGASGNLLWQYTSTLNFLSDPLAANGLVYVSGGDNYVYALNATTGTLAWKTCLCKGRLTGFAVATDIGGGAVYAVDSTNGYLYALNATTGAILWYYTNKATPGGAVYANGMLYFQSEISTKGTCPCTYYMNGANATTSNLVWSYLVAEPNAPAVANGVVYFLDQNAVFHALNATTGAQIWQVVIYYAVQSAAPTVYNGVVYLNGEQIGFDAQFQALQASNGSVIWTYYAPSNGGDLGHAVVANGIVFVNDSADGVRALNITNGSQYWVYPGSGAGLGNNPYLDAIAVGP